MTEVVSILIAVAALVLGLLIIGWAYGDFRKEPEGSSAAAGPQPPASG